MGDYEVQLQASSVFKKAAAYIRRYGWQEKGMGMYGGPRCSVGALNSAKPGKWDKDLADIMYKSLRAELKGLSLTQFNHKTQSGQAVARLFERTALKLTNN